jgi:ABC-type Fe3+ transport system permease subunit
VLLLVVFALSRPSAGARGRQRYAVAGGRHPLPSSAERLAARSPSRLLLPVLIGLPAAVLADGELRLAPARAVRRAALRSALANSLVIAAATAVLAVVIAVLLVYARGCRAPDSWPASDG